MDGQIETKLFEQVESLFNAHLQLNENIRIIFSGRFGSGKTTFLKHYFNQNQDKYNAFHLFPVSYSIANNQDIIEYLKYDIIIDILLKQIEVEDFDLKFIDALPFYLRKFSVDSIVTIVFMLSKLGKNESEFIHATKVF